MIGGIGVDAVSIEEFVRLLATMTDGAKARLFSRDELEAARRSDEAESYLATRFAVKEAVFKAVAHLLDPCVFDMRDVETLNREDGCPYVNLGESLGPCLEMAHIVGLPVSITVEAGFAIVLSLPRSNSEAKDRENMEMTRGQTRTIGALLAAVFVCFFEQALVNPALPSIMDDFDISATTAQWLVSAYALVEAAVFPLSAFLVGKFSTRQLFSRALVLFVIGSMLAGWAPLFGVLLAGRVMQAVCTGVMLPMCMTCTLRAFPLERRGFGMSLITLCIAFAPVVAPICAGVLIDLVGWHIVFGLMAPISFMVLLYGIFNIENAGPFAKTALDVPSIIVVAFGLALLVLGISTLFSPGHLVMAIVALVSGVVLAAVFVRRQLELDTPVLELKTLGVKQFRIAVIGCALVQAVIVSTNLLVAMFMQQALGLNATCNALTVLPGALSMLGMGLAAGRLFDRFGVRGISLLGASCMLVGSMLLASLPADCGIVRVGLSYLVFITGVQAVLSPLTAWGVSYLSPNLISHGSAITSTFNQVASAAGTAVLLSLCAIPSTGSSALTTAYNVAIGVHAAFIGVMLLMVVNMALVAINVRGRK